MVWVFGYFRASWTLRADLLGDFVCRLLAHMDEKGAERVEVALRPEDQEVEDHKHRHEQDDDVKPRTERRRRGRCRLGKGFSEEHELLPDKTMTRQIPGRFLVAGI